jgi:DNA-binding NtrC family response regulator
VIPLHEEDLAHAFPDAAWFEMAGVGDLLRRATRQDTTVLLVGETGTGKTRLARYLHDHSPRRQEPVLVIECGVVAESLLESELFGHVKGAFPGADRDRPGMFAAAGRGTLLLDEINSLPLPLQTRLLRAVDEHVFEPLGANRPLPLHARLMVAANAPLERDVAAGRFRADLYDRLNAIEIRLPPLRERHSAVRCLARRFLAEFVRRDRPDIEGVTADALGALERYHWPGNLRELRNVVERAVALGAGPILGLNDLPEKIRDNFLTVPAVVLRGSATEAPACQRARGQNSWGRHSCLP